MSHKFNGTFVQKSRIILYYYLKLMKSVLNSYYIENRLGNLPGNLATAFNSLNNDCRVLFIPSHRSYLDIAFSLYLFAWNLPNPAILTGNNLLSTGFGNLFRHMGSVFIRRTFHNDNLYKDVFKAYVESILIGAETPIMFYIEGTRSRTGKSCQPKIGLLKIAIDLLLNETIPNLMIIPASYSYERIMEEEEYAKEISPMFGDYVKPEETFCNFVKATWDVCQTSYGCAFVKFGQPIDVGQMIRDQQKNNMLDNTTQSKMNFVMNLAKTVIGIQIENFIYSPFPFVSILILSNYHSQSSKGIHSFAYRDLLNDMCSLIQLVPGNLNISITKCSVEYELRRSLELHCNLVHFDIKQEQVHVNMDDHLTMLQIQMYANEAMQLLIDYAVYLYATGTQSKFNAIRLLLEREFLFQYHQVDKLFAKAQQTLMNGQEYDGNKLKIKEKAHQALLIQIHYHLDTYHDIYCWIKANITETNQSIKIIQKSIENELKIPKNLIQNCIDTLKQKKCFKQFNNQTDSLQIDQHTLQQTIDQLSNLIKLNI